MMYLLFLYLLMTTPPTIFGFALVCRLFYPEKFRLRPSSFYSHTYMNEFGCWITSIVCWILCPVWALCSFIHWLFHIDVNDETDDYNWENDE